MRMFPKLARFFGSDRKPDYPFDKDKAFCFSRQGVIAGGGFYLTINPKGVVDYYSYVRPAPENECGMRDKGSDIFFVGLKEGRAEVTAIYEYPTCHSEEYTFTLNVDKDLCVTKINLPEKF